MTIIRLNPETLPHNPAYTQVALIPPSATLIYIGGQNAVNPQGEIVGHDIASQTRQAMLNVTAALASANAGWQDVVKMTIYLVQGHSLQAAFGAARQLPDLWLQPPTVSVLLVAGLARPEFLIEIEAVAAIQTGVPS